MRRAAGAGTIVKKGGRKHGSVCNLESRREERHIRELVEFLCGEVAMPFPEQYLDLTIRKFEDAGFEILEQAECFRPIRFFDVGALVWFARIMRILEDRGSIDGTIHRFMLVARKGCG